MSTFAHPASSWQVSERLRLREFLPADVDDLVRMHQDAKVCAQLIDDYPLHEPDVAALFVDRIRLLYKECPGAGIWCAERRLPPDTETLLQARTAVACGELPEASLAFLEQPAWKFCGWFNLMRVPHAPQDVEIGARLTSDAWGSALVLDGGEWLLRHAFDHLGHERVFGYCDPANRSAIHTLRALGFASQRCISYDGEPAVEFTIDCTHWKRWQLLPRRQRQRHVLSDSKCAPDCANAPEDTPS